MQDAFQPIPGLITCTGIELQWLFRIGICGKGAGEEEGEGEGEEGEGEEGKGRGRGGGVGVAIYVYSGRPIMERGECVSVCGFCPEKCSRFDQFLPSVILLEFYSAIFCMSVTITIINCSIQLDCRLKG